MMAIFSKLSHELIEAACEEDVGPGGDLTSALLKESDEQITGRVVVHEAGVICGLMLGPLICEVFAARLGESLEFTPAVSAGRDIIDGDAVSADACVASVRGARPAVLTAERTLLNFLGRMSGVATLTRRFVNAAREANPDVNILDTRKTLPGWRELDKYAVSTGGGQNHRFGLYDAILIKDNHLAGVPTRELAAYLTDLLRGRTDAARFVEVEVDNLEQFAEVCKVDGVNLVLLDNFTLEDMRAAVAHRDGHGLRGKLELESSGGVSLEHVAEIAATGIDRISIGALTHSAPALDIALEVQASHTDPARHG